MGEVEKAVGGAAGVVMWGFAFILIWGFTQPFYNIIQDSVIGLRHGNKSGGV